MDKNRRGFRKYSDADREHARELVKDMKFGQKLGYYITNYPIPTLIIVAAVIVVIYGIYRYLNPPPETILNVELSDSDATDVADGNVFDRYMEDYGIDPEEETFFVEIAEYNIYTGQTTIVRLSAGDADLIIGSEEFVTRIARGDGLMPLENLLPEDFQIEYADRLYYEVDDATGEEHLYAVYLPEDSSLIEEGYYSEVPLASIPYNTEREELAVSVIEYLSDEP